LGRYETCPYILYISNVKLYLIIGSGWSCADLPVAKEVIQNKME
jgi:hypothetical protein